MRSSIAYTALLAAGAMIAGLADFVPAEDGQTFSALQIAYCREVDARLRYLDYAERAEVDGYASVACLFRAIASAESVHAVNQRVAIEHLGGDAVWTRTVFDVAETAENLRAAIATELDERDRVYRRFADYARAECLYDALASINYARGAEATHAKLFADALERLDRASAPQPLVTVLLTISGFAGSPAFLGACYVCMGDGSAFISPVKRCPNCGTGGGGIVTFACPGPR